MPITEAYDPRTPAERERHARRDVGDISFNFKLYELPTWDETLTTAKPEDLIPYRYCPHLRLHPESGQPMAGQAVAFCMRHIAYMCGSCWSSHSFECKQGGL